MKTELRSGVGSGEVCGLEKTGVQGVGSEHNWKSEPVGWKKNPEPNGVNVILKAKMQCAVESGKMKEPFCIIVTL